MPEEFSEIACAPEVPIMPVQSRDAEQVAALVEDQFKVNSVSVSTEETLADKETVGGEAKPPPPPPPQALIIKELSKIARNFFDGNLFIYFMY